VAWSGAFGENKRINPYPNNSESNMVQLFQAAEKFRKECGVARGVKTEGSIHTPNNNSQYNTIRMFQEAEKLRHKCGEVYGVKSAEIKPVSNRNSVFGWEFKESQSVVAALTTKLQKKTIALETSTRALVELEKQNRSASETTQKERKELETQFQTRQEEWSKLEKQHRASIEVNEIEHKRQLGESERLVETLETQLAQKVHALVELEKKNKSTNEITQKEYRELDEEFQLRQKKWKEREKKQSEIIEAKEIDRTRQLGESERLVGTLKTQLGEKESYLVELDSLHRSASETTQKERKELETQFQMRQEEWSKLEKQHCASIEVNEIEHKRQLGESERLVETLETQLAQKVHALVELEKKNKSTNEITQKEYRKLDEEFQLRQDNWNEVEAAFQVKQERWNEQEKQLICIINGMDSCYQRQMSESDSRMENLMIQVKQSESDISDNALLRDKLVKSASETAQKEIKERERQLQSRQEEWSELETQQSEIIEANEIEHQRHLAQLERSVETLNIHLEEKDSYLVEVQEKLKDTLQLLRREILKANKVDDLMGRLKIQLRQKESFLVELEGQSKSANEIAQKKIRELREESETLVKSFKLELKGSERKCESERMIRRVEGGERNTAERKWKEKEKEYIQEIEMLKSIAIFKIPEPKTNDEVRKEIAEDREAKHLELKNIRDEWYNKYDRNIQIIKSNQDDNTETESRTIDDFTKNEINS
jgi:hypothetical protein